MWEPPTKMGLMLQYAKACYSGGSIRLAMELLTMTTPSFHELHGLPAAKSALTMAASLPSKFNLTPLGIGLEIKLQLTSGLQQHSNEPPGRTNHLLVHT